MTQKEMFEIIDRFDGEFRFLSNFYPVEVMYEDVLYPTVEHAYQAAKTLDLEQREKIRATDTPGAARKCGNVVELRSDWEEVKLGIMTDLVTQKFTLHSEFVEKLRATGYAMLIEGNWWGDTFWGVYKNVGKNHLGRILMRVREELRTGTPRETR